MKDLMNGGGDLVNQVKNFDVVEQFNSLREIIGSFLKSYKQNNSQKLILIDTFILFCFITFVIQFLYVLVNGVYPMNSLLAGLICSLGSITLSGKNNLTIVSLRFQVNPKTKVDGYSNEKAFAEFLVSSFILYFVCFNFLG
jgi:oligosaccharyltransferase complex subunit epsilon